MREEWAGGAGRAHVYCQWNSFSRVASKSLLSHVPHVSLTIHKTNNSLSLPEFSETEDT